MKKITKAILSFALTAVMSIGISTTSFAAVVGYIDGNDGNFLLNGEPYKASEKWKTDGTKVPDGFKEYTVHIGTHTYSEVKDEAGVVLIYLKPAANTAGMGTFYVFDEAAGSVSTFNYLNGVLVGTPDYVPSSVLNPTTLEVGASQYEAFQLTGSNFYYFYGTDASGLPDWFSYDPATGSVAKADAVALAMTEPTVITETVEVPSTVATPEINSNYAPVEVYIDKLASLRKVIIFLIVVILVLLFIIVNLLLSNFASSREGDVFKEGNRGNSPKASKNNAKQASRRAPAPGAKPAARPAAPERQSASGDSPKIHKASEKRRSGDVFPEDARKPAAQPAFGQPAQAQAPVYPNMQGQSVYPQQNQFAQAPVQPAQNVDPELAPIDISGMAGAPKYPNNAGYAPNMQPGQPSLNDVYGSMPAQPVQNPQGNGVIDFNNF